MSQRRPWAGTIAVVPLAGNQESDEADALGALLAKLLSDHLRGAGLRVADQREVARAVVAGGYVLPLDDEEAPDLRGYLKAGALVHGRYVLDEDGKMLGLRLEVDAPDVPRVPIEASTPLAGFGSFVERVALALIDLLQHPIDERLRKNVKNVSRPSNFTAFRQTAQAQAAWLRGRHELALAAISSALALEPDYEDAIAIEVAVARVAGDTDTAQRAFERWSRAAVKQGRMGEGAERLLMLGHWLRERGAWAQARSAYEAAQGIFRREGDERGAARALNNLANLDLAAGKTQAAIKTYRRSLRTFDPDEREADADTATTLANLALAHRALGQREEALFAIERALSAARGLRDTRLEAECLSARGAIHDDAGDWGQAGADYERAARLFDTAGDAAGGAAVKAQQAGLLKQQGNYRQAESLLLEALGDLERTGGTHQRALVWLNLADLYYAMQTYDQAWRYAERARDALDKLPSRWAEQAADLLETLENSLSPAAPEPPPSPPETPLPRQEPDSEDVFRRGAPRYDPPYERQNPDEGEGGETPPD
jgi:tetratricopeptide (TPR) repeat protein